MNDTNLIHIFLIVATLYLFSNLSLKGLINNGVTNDLAHLKKVMHILSGILALCLLVISLALLITLNCKYIILMLMTFFLIGKLSKL